MKTFYLIIDIKSKISIIKGALQQASEKSLSEYHVTLGEKFLTADTTLTEHCIDGVVGYVQLKVQIYDKFKRLLILDILEVMPEVKAALLHESQIVPSTSGTGPAAQAKAPTEHESLVPSIPGTGRLLWQFLLELLCNKKFVTIIRWVGRCGQFEIVDSEALSRLWGQKKNTPGMNYANLSRAIRGAYPKGLICKPSKHFHYKFTANIEKLAELDFVTLSSLENGVSFKCGSGLQKLRRGPTSWTSSNGKQLTLKQLELMQVNYLDNHICMYV